MLENYYEKSDVDKEIKNYPKEKLIDIVENGYDIEYGSCILRIIVHR